MSELKEKIKLFVANNSYLELSDDDSNEVRFTTRRNGNVGDEEPGQEDWNEIVRVAKLLKVEFPNQLKFNGETIDEWTDLIVKII